MKKIILFGAGKIGALMTLLLHHSDNYEVIIADLSFDGPDIQKTIKACTGLMTKNIDISNTKEVDSFLAEQHPDAIISCLPYFLSLEVADAAKKHNCHYFDLTEDIKPDDAVDAVAIALSYLRSSNYGAILN